MEFHTLPQCPDPLLLAICVTGLEEKMSSSLFHVSDLNPTTCFPMDLLYWCSSGAIMDHKVDTGWNSKAILAVSSRGQENIGT
jgi:hypothetical protein